MAIIQNLEAFVQSYPAGLDSVTDLQLSQNENGRQIRFTIGGVTIPAGSVATISGTKPDGAVYSNTGTIEGSDTVIFDEDVQMTAVFGTWYAKIRITNAGNTIASARVRFIIDKDPVDAGAIPSESQLNGLVAEAEEYAGAAEDAAERAAITYGSPLTAATASAMTDINRVYVYTGSESGYTYGNWYYYNGSAWASGGIYNSAAVETDTTLTESGVPADAKATGDKIDELKDDLSKIITEDIKTALLNCFDHVAWEDDHGQDYYDALEDALYPDTGLVRITAVFTQGSAVIYPSTPLNDLKAYLVVTGYYNNGTTKTITDYSLSGTLEVGTSTITVSKELKTTTFDVTVTAPYWDYEWYSSSGTLPTGLQVDDYNFTDEQGVLWANFPQLNLNYVGNMILEIECKWLNVLKSGMEIGERSNPQINVAKSESNSLLYGCRIIGSSLNGNVGYLIRVNASGSNKFTTYTDDVYHTFILTASSSGCSIEIDGTVADSGSGSSPSSYLLWTGISTESDELMAKSGLFIKSLKYKYLDS